MTTPRINGNMYSWASVSIRVGTTLVTAIKSISYEDSRTRGKGYGAGRHHAPIGRSSGKYETGPVTVSIEKSQCKELREALASESPSGSFGDAEFNIVVQYTEGDRNQTDTIEGCTWAKMSAKNEEGSDPAYDDVEFDCMSILWDGKALHRS